MAKENTYYMNVQGDWIYYTHPGDNSRIYKIGTDGQNRTLLCEDSSEYINIAGNWIFYRNFSSAEKTELYKIKTDGTERQKIE